MAELQHKFVTTNGIRMHYIEQGAGPLVVLCHGWLESRYSYRHQIPALAAPGFRVVAPDQRGYGQTDKPEPIEAYNILNLVGDVVGLVNSVGAETASIVGHDWGAPVAWHCALLRPDIFHAIALLSVPNRPCGATHPAQAMQATAGEENFYELYFQERGRTEAELEADPRRAMAMLLYSLSRDARPEEQWKFRFPKSMKFIDTGVVPKQLPPWLSEADLDFFAGELKRAGFRGGLNWYRNIERNWELTPFLDGAKLRQPALFVAGSEDCVGKMLPGRFQMAGAFTPNLKKQMIIPGAGHWTQQERPAEVNQLLIEFLRSL
jgi:pimeloyl-ACP methyl ester carboxylesterase